MPAVDLEVVNPDGQRWCLPAGYRYVPPNVPGTGPHAYFDSLVARPDHWKSYSLRDKAQIARYRNGPAKYADYLYPNDPDPRQQDAMKIVIPEYYPTAVSLTAPMSSTDTTAAVPTGQGTLNFAPGVYYQIDAEAMVFQAKLPGVGMTVTRGANGTTPAAHTVGASIRQGTNSLMCTIFLPMGTQDGHTYLMMREYWFGAEFCFAHAGIPNYKTDNFRAPAFPGARTGIWLETNNAWAASPHGAGLLRGRYYLRPTPPGTTNEPVGPQVGQFPIALETWLRLWAVIDQKKSDPTRTLYSLWVADATRGPVLIFDKVAVDVFGAITDFYVEFNTSHDPIKQGRGPLTAYARNIELLKDFAALPPMPRPL